MAGLAVPPPPPPPPPPPLLAPSGSSSQSLAQAAPVNNGLAMSGAGSQEGSSGKSWERPWSPRELRESAGKWSLAGDSGLLLYLRDFSQRMIQRTHEIEKQVDDLVSDVKTSSVKAHNVFNEFVVLANLQFVENRVYEEDINVDNQPPKPIEKKDKNREEVEADLVPKVMQAVRLGLEVLDKAFDRLDPDVAGDSDSDEPYQGDALYEPKDPYVDRPLPYLIGSTQFNESDDIGLRERPPDDTKSDHGSISESDEEQPAAPTTGMGVSKSSASELSSSVSESESDEDSEDDRPSARHPQTAPLSKFQDSEAEESDDLFKNDESDESDEASVPKIDTSKEAAKPKAAVPANDLASELAKKFGMPSSGRRKSASSDGNGEDELAADENVKGVKVPATTATSNVAEKSDSRRAPKQVSVKQKGKDNGQDSDDDPFKPPSDKEEDAWIGGQSGLFSKGAKSSIFDDDGDLFGSTAEPSKSAATSKTTQAEKMPPASNAASEAAPTNAKAKSQLPKVLFDGEDDDDLFSPLGAAAVKPKPAVEAQQARSSPQAKSSLAGTKKADDTAPPAKTDVNDMPAADDSNVEDGLFAEKPSASAPTPKKPEEPKSAKKLPAGAVSLFGNQPNPFAAIRAARAPSASDEDDEAERSQTARPSSLQKQAEPPARRESNAASQQNVGKALPPKTATPAATPVPPHTSKQPSLPQKSIFDDDDDDDLFSTMSSSKKNDTTKKASTLILDPEEVSTVKEVTQAAEPSVRPARSPSLKPAMISIFDDGEEGGSNDDDDSIFSAMGKKSPLPASKKADDKAEPVILAQSGSLAKGLKSDSDGDLFGTTTAQPQQPAKPKTGPEAAPAPKSATPVPTQKYQSAAAVPSSRSTLFGSDEEDDDLFAVKPSKRSANSTGLSSGKPAAPKAAAVKVATEDTAPLFGSTDPVPAATESLPPSKAPVARPLPSVKLDEDDDDDNDLFAPRKGVKPSPVASQGASPAATKKLAGAVPMFRGLDPATTIKKKAPLLDDEGVIDPLAVSGTKGAALEPSAEQQQQPLVADANGSKDRVLDEPSAELVSAKVKKLPGAVPMFGGGLEPAALLGKRTNPSSSKDSPAVATGADNLDTQPRNAEVKDAMSGDSSADLTTHSSPTVEQGKAETAISPSPLAASQQANLLTKKQLNASDEDDLFAPAVASTVQPALLSVGGSSTVSKTSTPAVRTTPSSGSRSQATVPASAAASSTAGGLFGSPDDDGDLFGFGSKQPVATVPATATKTELVTSSGKIEAEPTGPTIKPEGAMQPSKGTKAPPKVRDMFDDDDEDDLFGSGTKPKQEQPVATAKTLVGSVHQIKKPSGAVSMFGGLNPSAVLGSKLLAQASDSPDPLTEGDDLLGSTSTAAEAGSSRSQLPQVPVNAAPPAKKPPPGGVSMFGGMNPAQLLGKKAPSSEVAHVPAVPSDVDDVSASVGSPAENKDVFSRAASSEGALTGAHKGRARLQQKRRPQSREARLLAATQSSSSSPANDIDVDVAEEQRAGDSQHSESTAAPPPSVDVPTSLPAVRPEGKALASGGIVPSALAASSLFKKAKGGWDPDGAGSDDADDLFTPPLQSKVPPAATSAETAATSVDNKEEEDRQQITGSIASKVEDRQQQTAGSLGGGSAARSWAMPLGGGKLKDMFGNDDLFGSGDEEAAVEPAAGGGQRVLTAAVTVGVVAEPATVSASLPRSQVSDSSGAPSEALPGSFVSSVQPAPTSSLQDSGKVTGSVTGSSLIAAHDDLFGSSAMVDAKPAATVAAAVDEDDIFADASILKGASGGVTSTKTAERGAAQSAEDDAGKADRAAAPAADAKRSSKKAAKAVTKVDDMFADDTDIFSDLPSLPKVTTTAKAKKQASTGSSKKKQESAGSIFEDQAEEDIFAPSAKTKASKSHDKPKGKAPGALVTSIKKTSEDFVDPLAADKQ